MICYAKKASILAFASLISACGANDPGLAKKIGITKDQRAAIEARICSYDGNDCFLPIMVNIEGGTQVAVVDALPGEAKYAVSSTTARCPYLFAKNVSAKKRKNFVIDFAK